MFFNPSNEKNGSVCLELPRVASQELIVPKAEVASPIFFGVDTFSPTLVDLHTADERKIIWSSRAHRKMMNTLYRAWHGKNWKIYSFSFWSSILFIFGNALFLMGCIGEGVAHTSFSTSWTRDRVNHMLFYGAIMYCLAYMLSYFEVINSCHNLEIWLEEYFHGFEPRLRRRYIGNFPNRIDYWVEVLGMLGSAFFVLARLIVLRGINQRDNFGIVSVQRSELSSIIGYWIPFFAGSFLLLLSAHLAHVEVMHRWFSWRLPSLASWVTGSNLLGTLGIFISSCFQFIDPFSVVFKFAAYMLPFALGCLLRLLSCILSILELEDMHKRHHHPQYAILKHPNTYGSMS